MHLKVILASFLVAVVLVDQAESWRRFRFRRAIRSVSRFRVRRAFRRVGRFVKRTGRYIKKFGGRVYKYAKKGYKFYKKHKDLFKTGFKVVRCLSGDEKVPKELLDGTNKNYLEFEPQLLMQAYEDNMSGVEEYPELTEDEWNELVSEIEKENQALRDAGVDPDEVAEYDEVDNGDSETDLEHDRDGHHEMDLMQLLHQ